MIRMILHQIWNQRHQNFWIWLELALLSVFMWLAVDPLFTMTCITQVPRGCDLNGLYRMDIHFNFRKGYISEENFVPQMDHLLTQLNEHPLVEQVCLCDPYHFFGNDFFPSYPFYRSYQEMQADTEEGKNAVYAGTLTVPIIEGLEKWADLPGMLRLRDVVTGQLVHGRTDATAKDWMFLSSKMARDTYGTSRVRDSSLYFFELDYTGLESVSVKEYTAQVGGVFGDIKLYDHQTPSPMAIKPIGGFVRTCIPLVRVKEGVDEDEFREAIERDVLSRCVIDDVRRISVVSVTDNVRKATERSGAYNIIRLRSAMSFFGLLCAFLGVSGLFWVRCNDRRQDMGILRSMGASRGAVRRQMLVEATLLLTLAFLPAMLYIGWHVHTNGYDVGLAGSCLSAPFDPAYWFNRPVPHILAVTALTYVSMLLITLLATWLPVHRATRISPCDALRDE